MRIVSSFKDYYDSMRSVDREPEPLYVRETRTIPLYNEPQLSPTRVAADRLWVDAARLPLSDELERGVLAFCGRLHHFYVMDGQYCYTVEQLDVAWANSGRRARDRRDLRGDVERLNRTIDDAPFLLFKAPALLRIERMLVVNPSLRKLGFAARMDPWTAWQELSMFLGNNMVAATTTAPRPITDELKAHAKGFDKASFRNQKNRPKSDRGDW